MRKLSTAGNNMMRWQPYKMILLAGLCAVGLSGCSSMKLGKEAITPLAFDAPGEKPSYWSTLFKSKDAAPELSQEEAAQKKKEDMYEGKLAKARLAERRNEIPGAIGLYEGLLQERPDDARVYHRLAVIAVGKTDFAKAEEHFAKAMSLATPTAEVLSDLGYCRYLQYKLPEAEKTLQEALKLDSTYAPAINNLALVVGRQGRTKEAFDLFKRTNTEAQARANLAYVLAQNGELKQSQQVYMQALTMDNEMKAAAEAALQIKDREETKRRLASNTGKVVPAVSHVEKEDGRKVEPSRLPKVDDAASLESSAEKRPS